MSPTHLPFWDAVERIRESRPSYAREAYGFVVAALGATVQALPRERVADPERRHLTGQELLEGVVRLARSEFGMLAPAVFREWGVRDAADVGRVVFELVEAGQLSARTEDRLEDFVGGLDLEAALAAEHGFEGRRPAGDPVPRAPGAPNPEPGVHD